MENNLEKDTYRSIDVYLNYIAMHLKHFKSTIRFKERLFTKQICLIGMSEAITTD